MMEIKQILKNDRDRELEPAVVEAIKKNNPPAQAAEILGKIRWDGLNGCWCYGLGSMYVGVETYGYTMYVGVETDGHTHT